MRYGNVRRLITFAGYREPNDGIALVGVSRRVSDKKKQNRVQILYRHRSPSTHTNKPTQCARFSFPILLLYVFNLRVSVRFEGHELPEEISFYLTSNRRNIRKLASHLHSNTFTLATGSASFFLARWLTWPEYLLHYDREISLITGHSNAYHDVDRVSNLCA